MMTASEALGLPSAKLTVSEIAEMKEALELIRKHVVEKMQFAGPPPIDIKVSILSSGNAAKAICVYLGQKNRLWNVNANLMVAPPLFQGGTPTPHHWTFQLVPKIEAYDEIEAQQLKLSLS